MTVSEIRQLARATFSAQIAATKAELTGRSKKELQINPGEQSAFDPPHCDSTKNCYR